MVHLSFKTYGTEAACGWHTPASFFLCVPKSLVFMVNFILLSSTWKYIIVFSYCICPLGCGGESLFSVEKVSLRLSWLICSRSRTDLLMYCTLVAHFDLSSSSGLRSTEECCRGDCGYSFQKSRRPCVWLSRKDFRTYVQRDEASKTKLWKLKLGQGKIVYYICFLLHMYLFSFAVAPGIRC